MTASDLAALNAGCAASLNEKLRLFDYVPLHKVRTVIDYGAGDGTLYAALRRRLPAEHSAILLDRNTDQSIRLAHRFRGSEGQVLVNPSEADYDLGVGERRDPDGTMLVLSSVLHEQKHPYALLSKLLSFGFQWVVFRDFAFVGPDFCREAIQGALHDLWPDERHESHLQVDARSLEGELLSAPYRLLTLHHTRPGWMDALMRRKAGFAYVVGVTTHLEAVLERTN